MSELSLIPFGLKLPEQILVDVSEVDRGRNCDCICSSCKTPLIARQGSKNEWHFAHDTNGASTATVKACKYSFWVSVVLMAKQILKEASAITLPSLTMYTNDVTKYEVAKRTTVKCDDLRVDVAIDSTTVDATFKLGKYTIAVFFTAPHKKDKLSLENINNDKIGILEISLNDAKKWLYGNSKRCNYRKTLELNIINSVKCKKWIYHPRKNTIEKQHNVSLHKEKYHGVDLNKPNFASSKKHFNEPIKKHDMPDRNYVTSGKYGKCVICGNNLTKSGACPDCMRRF